MLWRENGIVIGIRKYGDEHCIISVFTESRGLTRGLVKLTKKSPLRIGDHIAATWRGRLPSNLGHFTYELISSTLHYYFHDSAKLMCVAYATSLMEKALPENDAHPVIYHSFTHFIDTIANDIDWRAQYIKLELDILSQLGFALDLSRCAVSSSEQDLEFISPKTGRAISRNAGLHYKNRLLPLPKTLHAIQSGTHNSPCSRKEFKLSLKILGYFLQKHLLLRDAASAKQRAKLVEQL